MFSIMTVKSFFSLCIKNTQVTFKGIVDINFQLFTLLFYRFGFSLCFGCTNEKQIIETPTLKKPLKIIQTPNPKTKNELVILQVKIKNIFIPFKVFLCGIFLIFEACSFCRFIAQKIRVKRSNGIYVDTIYSRLFSCFQKLRFHK